MNRVLVPALLAPPVPPRGAAIGHLGGATMGTTWSVRYLAAADPAPLRAGIEARLERVVAQMSGWRADSDLDRFNRAPAGSRQALPGDFLSVLRCALATAEASGGAYDPTSGPLVDLWGFGPQPAAGEGPPPADRIALAMPGSAGGGCGSAADMRCSRTGSGSTCPASPRATPSIWWRSISKPRASAPSWSRSAASCATMA